MNIIFYKKALTSVAALCLAAGFSHSGWAGPVLDGIKSTKQINRGFRDSLVPYSFLGSKGEALGYSNDVCREIDKDIEKAVGTALTTEMQPVNAQTRQALVVNNTIQLECGGTSDTAARREFVNFVRIDADPIVPVVLWRNTTINKLADFKGKSVAVVAGTTAEKIFREKNAKDNFGVNLVVAKDYASGLILVGQGRADAMVTNGVLLAGEVSKVANKADYKIRTDIMVGDYEPIGIMFGKNDKEFETIVRSSVARLKQDGTLERLYKKWFQSPIAPAGTNLNIVWTPAARRIVME